MYDKNFVKELIKNVKKRVSESPNTHYIRPLMNCLYAKGKCSDGSVGCIFGQVLQRMGVELKPEWDSGDGLGISGVLRELMGVELVKVIGDPDIGWCSEFQSCQDIGKFWSHCLEDADRYRNNCKGE